MKTLLPLSIFIFLFSACNKHITTEEIDSDVGVSASKENLNVQLAVETEKLYPSSGYEIIFCDKVVKNKVHVKFKKITVHDFGFAAFTPAQCFIDLGELANGEYEITFELHKKKTKGKLIVGSTIELTLDAGSNVKPV